jgi:glutamate-1-semialdehyde aminotransferase
VRLARAYTRRSKVVCCGYHGWHDWYIAVTDRARGVPPAVAALSATFEYNDLESAAAAIDRDTACVVLEPTVFDAPKPGFLEGLRELCHARGALLVFDEMWTGFRLALGGAQVRYGVVPDLATFSKAVANGMPLSILAGRAEVMTLLERDVFFFTTFGGETLSLAAARATIGELAKHRVPDRVPDVLDERGARLRAAVTQIAADSGLGWLSCVGAGCRTMLRFEREPLLGRSLVQQELLRRGILWNGPHNLSLAHDDAAIDALIAAYREVLPMLGEESLLARLEGEPVEPVFRKTSGFNTRPAPR